MLLSGKLAVVTGSNRGIGRAITEVFLDHGAQVVGVDLGEDFPVREGFTGLQADVSSTADCQRVFDVLSQQFGTADILVNCAGITRDAMTRRMTEEQWDQVIAVDLKGVWNLTRLIGPSMEKKGSGSIISISSAVALFGNIGQVNYAAAKAGLIGMTKTWAKEFAQGGGNVRVNAIAPGFTMTDMMRAIPENLLDRFRGQTMLGRLAEPKEIANAALFLASDLSSYVTGEVLNVNGGLRM